MGTRKQIKELRGQLKTAVELISKLQKHNLYSAEVSLNGYKFDVVHGETVWYKCECGCESWAKRNIFTLSHAVVKQLVDQDMVTVTSYLQWLETKDKLTKVED